jgi:hypothetical protein
MDTAKMQTTVADVYPCKWLHADDLGGRQVIVKIATVGVEEFRQRDGSYKRAIVLAFERATKRLILNKTQGHAIATILGTERLGDWPGRTIRLGAGSAPNGKPTITILGAKDGE